MHDAAADVAVVLIDRGDDLIEREFVLHERFGRYAHLVLPLKTAPRIDLGDARHGTNLRANDPLVRGAGLGAVAAVTEHDVVEHFAQSVRHRPHLRPFDLGRQDDGGQALADELPGDQHVGPFVEGDDHLRESEFGKRTNILEVRHARQCLLDRKRHASFDFFRIELRYDRVDLNLHRRDVGKRIDVQSLQRRDAENGEAHRHGDDREAMVQREVDDSGEHE